MKTIGNNDIFYETNNYLNIHVNSNKMENNNLPLIQSSYFNNLSNKNILNYKPDINNLKNNIINNDINETEKNNNEKRVIRCESYKSSLLKENKEPNQLNEIKSYEKNNSAFKINNRQNIPVRLKYSKNNKYT